MSDLDCYETSLSKMSDHDFYILVAAWARGIDWVVFKCGRKWRTDDRFGNFPLFKTKAKAYETATNLLLIEGRYRTSLGR